MNLQSKRQQLYTKTPELLSTRRIYPHTHKMKWMNETSRYVCVFMRAYFQVVFHGYVSSLGISHENVMPSILSYRKVRLSTEHFIFINTISRCHALSNWWRFFLVYYLRSAFTYFCHVEVRGTVRMWIIMMKKKDLALSRELWTTAGGCKRFMRIEPWSINRHCIFVLLLANAIHTHALAQTHT